MKNLPKIIAAMAVLLTGAAVGMGSHFKALADRHQDQVRQELRRLLGDSVRFDSLNVRLLWQPSFVVREFRIADDNRFAATPILKARELLLGISLSQLFAGHIVIDALTLVEPEMQIITDETGLVNLSALGNKRKELSALPKQRSGAPAPRRHSAVRFAIDAIRVDDGRIVYLDRSVTEPAELQLRNVDFNLTGLDLALPTRVRLAAALSEGLGQDMRIEGMLKSAQADQSWYQREIELAIQFDSLYAPMVVRAFAGLRERLPRELDVTGPMALQAKASGSLARPRLDNITLKAPLFGSSEYNALVTGSVEFTEQRSWSDAKLQGRLKIAPLALSRARLLPALRDTLPKQLVTDGNVSFYSRFEGSWNHLRMGALLRAEEAEFSYPGWLRKPAKSPAQITARLSRRQQRLTIHESELTLGSAKTVFTGAIRNLDAPRLQFKLAGEDAPLAVWMQLGNGNLIAKSGRASWHLAIERLPEAENHWSIEGQLHIADGEIHNRDSSAKVEKLTGQITFLDRQARIDKTSFTAGGTPFELTGTIANIFDPKVDYTLTAPGIDLANLPALAMPWPLRLKQVRVQGAAQALNDGLSLSGNAAAAAGNVEDLALSDFRAAFSWSAAGLQVTDLTFRAAQGRFQAKLSGRAAAAPESRLIDGAMEINSAALGALLASMLPALKDRLDGNLSGHVQYDLRRAGNGSWRENVKASGDTTIQRGVIKDFNLLSQLLLRGSGATVSAGARARLPAALIELAENHDTAFETLKANFTFDKGRLSTDNLILATPDYTVTGAGWFALDRTTRWNGLLVLSPRLTQEIQREFRWMRHLLDRRGRMAIPFRIDGTIPDVRIRIENRNFSQAMRGSAPRNAERAAGNDNRPANEEKSWIPDALERFLNR